MNVCFFDKNHRSNELIAKAEQSETFQDKSYTVPDVSQ